MFTLYTFGDSILDCAHYNAHRVDPACLIARNDDRLFPEFQGRDLSARGPARVVRLALDGATLDDLPDQGRGIAPPQGRAAALVTVGGNDLLSGLIVDAGPGFERFARGLEHFVATLPIRPILLGTVYDPTCGDDARNFLGIDPALARQGLSRMNDVIAKVARAGSDRVLVDLHARFLTGDPSWFVNVIEPSLRGASEVRRAFLPGVLEAAG